MRNELPLWLVIAVVSRDILIVAAVLLAWLLDQRVRIKPLAVSKANTAVPRSCWPPPSWPTRPSASGSTRRRVVLVWITGALTLLSLAAYLRAWFLHMTSYDSTARTGARTGRIG